MGVGASVVRKVPMLVVLEPRAGGEGIYAGEGKHWQGEVG